MNGNYWKSVAIARDFATAVAAGDVTGWSFVRKFGSIQAVDTTFRELWEYGPTSAYQPYPTSAATFDIVSNSDSDKITVGTGLQQIALEYLDDSFDPVTQTFDMNGTTTVVTTGYTGRRLIRAYGVSSGTYGTQPNVNGSNIGNITINFTGGSVCGYITSQFGQTQKLQYTVPNGYTAYIRSLRIFAETGKSVEVRGYIRLNADDVTTPFSPWRRILHWPGINQPAGQTADFALVFPAKTDISVLVRATATTANVSGVLDILLKAA